MARTKIVATLGPASSKPTVIRAMIKAGANVFRVNFSHGTHAQHLRTAQLVRAEAKRAKRNVSILADLCGPKIRMGTLAGDGVKLRGGQAVAFTTAAKPAKQQLPIAFDELHRHVRKGERMLLDDGKIAVRVTAVTGQVIHAKVEVGGLLKSGKGISLPETEFDLSPLTAKDRTDVVFAVKKMKPDLFALSFVQRASDIDALRSLIAEHGPAIPIIAKIEKRRALDDLSAILDTSDGVMVARGDLGVEMPFEEVPGIQKRIIHETNVRAKPVITATEMLESMITTWRPTRAEATDVANAILDGTDAVMLSAETAVGHDPANAVKVLERIACATESGMRERTRRSDALTPEEVPSSICQAATQIGRDLEVDAILCLTMSGTTARRISAHRPRAPIFAISPLAPSVRALNLTWGVSSIHLPDLVPPRPHRSFNIGTAFEQALRHLRKQGHLKKGQRVVCVGGIPFHVIGTTNLIAVHEVP